MGVIRIQTAGSFRSDSWETTAMEGGHVQALARAIAYLSRRLGEAVKQDAQLTIEGEKPPLSPLGEDKP